MENYNTQLDQVESYNTVIEKLTHVCHGKITFLIRRVLTYIASLPLIMILDNNNLQHWRRFFQRNSSSEGNAAWFNFQTSLPVASNYTPPRDNIAIFPQVFDFPALWSL